MVRLIDVDALRETLGITGTADSCKGCTYCDNHIGFACNTYDAPSFSTVCEMIDGAPIVDAVPVVRCKDCKWWVSEKNECIEWYDNPYAPADGYCNRAERKEQ